MRGKELSEALRSGKRVYGTAILSIAPNWPAAMASSGIDMAFIESEHTPMGRETLSMLCHSYAARGIAPVVRIPEPDPYRACMVLDGGAQGVIVPYVESAAQVRELRGAVKLRPLKGDKLYDALEGREPLSEELETYLAKFNRNAVLIVNIESIPAMNNLDEILAEPGLDAVLVGPHDLSINLGIPEEYENPLFLETISTIIRKARENNVGVGTHLFTSIDQEIAWGKEGANLIMHSSDFALARATLGKDIAYIKNELGEEGEDSSGPVVV
jgi:4-hydroxy-2-oxoheptanedioate aldolase